MLLGEKIRHLRSLEGEMRGLARPMTQQEVLRAIHAETGQTISQAYLSQIETGKRPHLTNTFRLLLANFFKVHPGFLVDDPEGFHAELRSEARLHEDKLDLWLAAGAERFRHDEALSEALLTIARHPDSCQALALLARILEEPGLPERLHAALTPVQSSSPIHSKRGRKESRHDA